jgi:hypothetical protein
MVLASLSFVDTSNILKYKELNYYEINVLYHKAFIFRAFDGDIQYFENGLMVDMQNIILAGMSGGPLMKDGTVRGMIFARDNCISAKYLTLKLTELSVEYHK